MALTTWSFPTTIVFGPGSLSALPAHIKRLNAKRPLLVCDAGVVKAGIAARVQKVLETEKLAVSVFDKVDPNPVESNVVDGVAAYRAHQADIIVSLGGGSPLDAGKLIALKTTHDRPLHEYDDAIGGDAHITSNVPPIITIPTTAGTGSEVGRSGVVTLAATGRKTVIFSPYFMAKVAILDPELTVSMPPRITAATGFDALTHCLEAYCSVGDHPMADAIALGGLELCARSLARAVEKGDDLERPRRHDEGGDDGRGLVPEGARRVPLAGAPALEREEPSTTAWRTRSVCRPSSSSTTTSPSTPKLERVRGILAAAKSQDARRRAPGD